MASPAAVKKVRTRTRTLAHLSVPALHPPPSRGGLLRVDVPCRTVPAQVLVPIAAGSEPAEAFVPIAVLRRAGADVTVAAAGAGTGLRVHAMYGVTVVADFSVADCADASYDLVVLPVRTRRQPETPL